MSGGYFDYWQYHIDRIADDVDNVIESNKMERLPEETERWMKDDNGKVRDEYKYYGDYNDDSIELMKQGVWFLKVAAMYAQRIDYLLSGDDGEDSFKRRTENELDELMKQIPESLADVLKK